MDLALSETKKTRTYIERCATPDTDPTPTSIKEFTKGAERVNLSALRRSYCFLLLFLSIYT